jgi:ubiquinone/menaquinone biosynthesis C-methylase UbiE
MTPSSEAERLESLWSGGFGDAYVERNVDAGAARGPFWAALLERTAPERVLEVGCNVGANLRHLVDHVSTRDLWGLDVNEESLRALRGRHPDLNAVWGRARDLPFADQWFDLVISVAVLIHQPDDTLPFVIDEMVRCTRGQLAIIEYEAETRTEISYRDQTGAFFKRPFGAIVAERHPELTVLDNSELTRDDGFDDGLTYWLFGR